MENKFSFLRFSIITESISFEEILRRTTNNESIQSFIKLNLPVGDFVEELFGISNFIFVPNESGVSYQKNMINHFLLHALHLLSELVDEMDKELLIKAVQYVSTIRYITKSEGWNNNRILRKDIEEIEKILGDESLDCLLGCESSPLIREEMYFYVSKGQNMVISKTNRPEFYNTTNMTIFYGERNQTKLSEFECTVNVLCEFLHKHEIQKSFSDSKINYMIGETDDGVHQEINFTVRTLSRCMKYLINSTSWREKQMFGFDAWELESKQRFGISDYLIEYYEGRVASV